MVSRAALASQRRHFSVAVPVAGGLIVLFALLLQPWFPVAVRQTASSSGLLLAGTLGAVSCEVRARREIGSRRRAWRLLVAAGVVAIAGNGWAAAAGADPVRAPSAVSDWSIATALALSIAAILHFPGARRRGIDLLLLALDGLVMGVGVLLVATVLVYAEVLRPTSTTTSALSSLLIPLLDVVLVTVCLLLMVRTRGPSRPALALVATGFLTYAVTDLSFAVQVAQGDFTFGTMLDLGWIAGYLLISLAAWLPDFPSRSERAVVTSEARDTFVVFGVLLVAVAVELGFGSGARMQLTQAVLWILLVLAVGTRQVLLAHDNAVLRRGLERRVREQTADLRRLARQHEVLLNSVGDGIYGVDDRGQVTFVNPSGARVLGHPAEDLLGAQAHDAFHAPAPDGTPYPYGRCYIAEAIRSRVVVTTEDDVYVRADGEHVPVEISASPLVDEDVVRGAVVVFRDVTQRREVDRMKNEFLSVVSHELRTPLTSIRGSLGLLVSGALGELSPRATSIASTAMESTDRLSRLINDILDVERIRSGSRPLELVETDAETLVRASVTELEVFARTHGIRVDVGCCDGRVAVDRDRIVQTLTNLVGNAIKFSDRDGRVVVDAVRSGGEVRFRVRDRGRGIPADRLEAVFERFHQVDSSDARQKGGTGLGLAISREIVESHGGRIWAESDLGAGTTVQFALPTAERPDPA